MRPLALVLLVCSLAAVGCGSSGAGAGGRPVVVATTTQVGDFARVIGGDRVEVRTLLRANADPHEYEPRPSDVRTVSEADLVLRSGGDVDDWLDGVLRSSGSHARSLMLVDRVPEQRLDGKLDPHWWQNPRDVELTVPAIRDALTRIDPGGRAGFTRRAAAYTRRLAVLDRD